jgi:hypothetical protein
MFISKLRIFWSDLCFRVVGIGTAVAYHPVITGGSQFSATAFDYLIPLLAASWRCVRRTSFFFALEARSLYH